MSSPNIQALCPNNNITNKSRNIDMNNGGNMSKKNATNNKTSTTHANINTNNAGPANSSPSPSASTARGLSCEDNKYLADVIGEVLTKCLAELSECVPADPIEWIAHWLYNHVNVKRYHEEKATFLADLEKARIEEEKIDTERKYRLMSLKGDKRNYKKVIGGGRSPTETPSDMSQYSLRMKEAHERSEKKSRGFFSRRPSSNYMFDSATMIPRIPSPAKSESGWYLHEDGSRFTIEEMEAFQRVRVEEEKRRRLSKSQRIPSPPRSESGRYLHRDGTRFTDDEMLEFQRQRIDDDNRRQMEKRQRVMSMLQSPPRSASGRYLHKDGRPYTDDEVKAFQKSRLKAFAAEWGVNCRLALVCRHPVLGDMQARPPLMYPDTPERWEKQGYSYRTLYDHEVYSRNTDTDQPEPHWKAMDTLTLHEIASTGPWIASGYSTSARDTFTDTVCGVRGWVTGGTADLLRSRSSQTTQHHRKPDKSARKK